LLILDRVLEKSEELVEEAIGALKEAFGTTQGDTGEESV
jgi:hypothetical protein